MAAFRSEAISERSFSPSRIFVRASFISSSARLKFPAAFASEFSASVRSPLPCRASTIFCMASDKAFRAVFSAVLASFRSSMAFARSAVPPAAFPAALSSWGRIFFSSRTRSSTSSIRSTASSMMPFSWSMDQLIRADSSLALSILPLAQSVTASVRSEAMSFTARVLSERSFI